MRGLGSMLVLLQAAACDSCGVDGTESGDLEDGTAACACFEGDATSVEMLCDPGIDCGVVELVCPGEHNAFDDGPCDLEDAEVANPEVLACAVDLLVEGEAGTFGWQQGLLLGKRTGTFYTDGVRGFSFEFESYDIGYELSPVVAGPLRDRDHLRACADDAPEQLFACLRAAIDHVEEECTRACANGLCDGDGAD
jgi:hypothetical protein